MVIVMGTVKLDPAKLEAAKPAMAKMVATSRAEAGCIAYAYAQDLLDPATMHVAEKWRNRAALTEHFATPHMAEWRGAMGDLGLTGRDLRVYEADEGAPI